MPEPLETIDKVLEFLRYQREVYGPLNDDILATPDDKVVKTDLTHSGKEPETMTTRDKDEQKPIMNDTPAEKNSDIMTQIQNAGSLDDLETLCGKADFLKTDLENTQLVFGVGNPVADLMIIGEAPGFQEDKQGEPFVGRAGQLLNKILAAINFQRKDVYIANILKHRPPNNRDPQPEERERSLPVLIKQIELIKPKIILCLGRISAQTLLKTKDPMYAMRSKFHPFMNGIELMVTYHPAALLRNPKWKRDTWEDVQMLRKRYDELGSHE